MSVPSERKGPGETAFARMPWRAHSTARVRVSARTPAFAAAARPSGGGAASAESLYLLGRFHLSDEGHRVAAEAIERLLTEGAGRGLVEPR